MVLPVNTVEISNGETIGYREREGGDVPVVLLHGNQTSSRHFDVVFEAMDDRYKLYAMDMRGFGASSYNTPIDGIEEFAEDVSLFVEELGLESFHLIGWSTGGSVGMVYAADNPERVRKLIGIEPVSTRGWPIYATDDNGNPTDELLTTRQAIAETPTVKANESGDPDTLKEVMWDPFIYTKNAPSDERYDEYMKDALSQRNVVDVFYGLATFNISDESTEASEGTGKAAKIEVPTLVLRGDRDLIISEEMAQTTVEDIGNNAELVTLRDCGHSPFIDDLDQLLTKVTEFLET